MASIRLESSHLPFSTALPLHEEEEQDLRVYDCAKGLMTNSDGMVKEAPAHRTKPHYKSEWRTMGEFCYLQGDSSSLVRMTNDYASEVFQTPFINSKAEAMLGMTSSMSILTGMVAYDKGYSYYDQSKRIGDVSGKVLGGLKMARGRVETLAGLTITPYRIIGMTDAATTVKSVGVAAKILGKASGVLYSLVYFLMMVPIAINMMDIFDLSCDLSKAGKNASSPNEQVEKKYEFLMSRLQLTDKDYQECLEYVIENKVTDYEKKEALKILPQLPKEYKEIAWNLTRPSMGEARENYFLGICKRIHDRLEAKQIDLGRLVGTDALEKLLKIKEPNLEQKTEIVEAVEKGITNAQWRDGIILAACLLGVVAFSLATFGMGPTLLAGLILVIITSLSMIGIDGYFLMQAVLHESPTKNEKILQMIFTVAFFTLTVATVATGGAFIPAVIGVCLAVVWLGIYFGANYFWSTNENKPHDEEAEEYKPVIGFPAASV